MDNLDALDKQALTAASVLGQRFSLDPLRHLIASHQYDCSDLIAQYLVRPEGDDYLFAHALVREGVYNSLLKTRRSTMHRAAAEWYATRDPALRAEHLDRADDPVAPQAYLEAARSQALSFRHEQALRLAERGRALAKEHGDVFALECCRGEALNALGSISNSIDAYESAASIAKSDVERCSAWLGQVAGMRITDRTDDALLKSNVAGGNSSAYLVRRLARDRPDIELESST